MILIVRGVAVVVIPYETSVFYPDKTAAKNTIWKKKKKQLTARELQHARRARRDRTTWRWNDWLSTGRLDPLPARERIAGDAAAASVASVSFAAAAAAETTTPGEGSDPRDRPPRAPANYSVRVRMARARSHTDSRYHCYYCYCCYSRIIIFVSGARRALLSTSRGFPPVPPVRGCPPTRTVFSR